MKRETGRENRLFFQETCLKGSGEGEGARGIESCLGKDNW